MSGASVAAGGGTGAASARARKVGSIKRERRWALVGAALALARRDRRELLAEQFATRARECEAAMRQGEGLAA